VGRRKCWERTFRQPGLCPVYALGRSEDEARAVALAETIQLASLCGLGQAAPIALLRGLEAFGEALRASR
jgi:hypothetical protein